MTEKEARAKAKKLVAMAQGSAGLEGQGVSEECLRKAEDWMTQAILDGTNHSEDE